MPVEAQRIAAAVERVRGRIAVAAGRCGRSANEIRLVAVTKTFGPDAVRAGYEAGLRHFGENRVQEWEGKANLIGELPGTVFHLIGHLQRNKARRAVALFHRIDSVDSEALASRLNEFAAEAERVLPVLIEVHLSDEEAKSGVEAQSLPALANLIAGCEHLNLRGLMTVPPWAEDPELARPYFRRLRELRDATSGELGRALPVLSMGMSHDFEVAIEEGSTEVRIGTDIFGRRPKPIPLSG